MKRRPFYALSISLLISKLFRTKACMEGGGGGGCEYKRTFLGPIELASLFAIWAKKSGF
jgi:hypothetical protein